jgi:hypothetical protein
MATKWEQFKKLKNSNEVKPWDFLKPSTEYAEKEEAEKRFSICLECPQLIQSTKRCSECGCFMAAKTKLKLATCPLNKW